ncbi:MAG: hypothetical protein ACLGG0_02325 [Bacteriovoracia bacterium]
MSTNKALKMSEIVLVKYLFKKDWAPLEEIVDRYSKDFGDIYDVGNDKEVVQVITTSPATLVIASVVTKEDLAQVLSFLKTQRRLLKDGNMKVSVVNYLNNKQVETALMKLGCQEVMDPSMKSKALKFKMDFWKKALSIGVNKTHESQNLNVKEKAAAEAKQQKAAAEAKAAEVKPIVWTEPLKHVDDMWINKAQSDVKKVLNRWMIKIMGPSPFVAQWTEVQGQRGVWQFVFKEGARESFHMADGHWYFSGDQKPDFVWKENLWLISGQKFQLYYQEDDETIIRFRANPQSVEVSKNSNYALSREKLIIETFDQEVLVKKGMLDNSKTEIEDDEKAGDGLLEQQIDGADKIKTHYDGKVKQELPDTPEEAKKIDAKADRLKKHYDGESETEDLGPAHYDGKLDHEAEREKKNKLHKAGADRFGDQDGDAGTDDVGPDKYKGKTEYQKSDRKSNYGGKSETDDLGENHWSNQKDEAKIAAKKKREAAEEAAQDEFEETDHLGRKKVHPLDAKRKNHNSGESSTDDLGDSHYSNKKKEAVEEKPEKEKSQKREAKAIWDDEEEVEEIEEKKAKKKVRKSAFEDSEGYEEEEASAMKGKSHTDDLGEDHYSNEKSEKKSGKVRSKERPEAIEDEEEIEDSEESSPTKRAEKLLADKKKKSQGTDDLGSAHYSGKSSREEIEEEEEDEQSDKPRKKKNKAERKTNDVFEEDEDEYHGESATDELGPGHYKGKVAKKKSEEIEEEDGSAEEELEAVAKREKKQASVRERKMHVIDDLLPEGNADDPMEDVVPEGFDDAPKAKGAPISRTAPRLVKSINDEDELDEPEEYQKEKKERAAKKARESVPSLADEEPTTDDGKPVVNADATIKVVLRRKANPGVERIIRLDDFFENTAIVHMEGDCLKSGELVELTLTFDYMKRSKRINVSGICLESDGSDSGEAFCTIQMEGSDLKMFEQFMLLYQLRQQHIHHFIKTAKGY